MSLDLRAAMTARWSALRVFVRTLQGEEMLVRGWEGMCGGVHDVVVAAVLGEECVCSYTRVKTLPGSNWR